MNEFRPSGPYPPARPDAPWHRPDGGPYTGFTPEPGSVDGQILMVPADEWEFEGELAELLRSSQEEADQPMRGCESARPRQSARHRRRRIHWPAVPAWPELVSLALAALTVVVVTAASVLSAMVSYDPLRHLASLVSPTTSDHLARAWPLLVFGPWVAGSLSILRSAMHRRDALHSWATVLFFSVIAVLLCITDAPRTLPGMAVDGLPPVTALACFHQLVRQITLTRPPQHARRRHPNAHHRR
jgi:Protein of unknown function (DUF2637)